MIANQCNISKEYLARFFKKEMELTVENYINNVRAEHAYHELKHSKNNLPPNLQSIMDFRVLER